MPNKLKVLISLQVISAFLNLILTKWIAAGVGIALLIGLVKGHEGVRTILIGLNFIGLAVMVFMGIATFSAIGHTVGQIAFGVAMLGVAHTSFSIWCLQQPDVQDWMYKKSLPEGLRDL
ncbi:MAG: hypothetical protein K1X64_23180 [Myxococcaceae bacterium]|nr:hypothetical protein [Myxococcaceae bacterium]